MNTNRREKRVWRWEQHRGWTEAGKKANGHNHRPGHAGMDDQSAFYLLQSISNQQAQKQPSVSATFYITLLLTALPLWMHWSLERLFQLQYCMCLSVVSVTLKASCLRWPMLKTLPSYETPQPFSTSAKGMQYSEWTLLKRTQDSE